MAEKNKMISGKNNLHKAEKPWKPSFVIKSLYDANKTVWIEEKIKRNTLCILNKLTPEKFEILLRQLIQLEFDTKEKLDVVIDLIFEKAIYEPLYSIVYANLCKHLCMNKVLIKEGEYVDIHYLLVSKCKKELEENECDELKEMEKYEILKNSDSVKNILFKQKLYEEEKKNRVCQVGKMKFIGELFNVDLDLKYVIQDCIQRLLYKNDENSLECLCQLLTTTGKKLDAKNRDKENIDLCFEQLQKIVDEHLHSKRIRFLLQDVLDLRRNNWTPRRAQNNPKTIQQIHREVIQEALEREKGLNGYKKLKDIGLKSSDLSPEEVKLKSKHLIEEFLNNNNFEFIIRFIKDFTPTTVNIFIKTAIYEVLERSSQARSSIGQLLVQLLEKNIITIESYKNGFDSIIKFGDETKEDKPMIWMYIFEILKPIVVDDNRFSLNLLKDILLPCIPSKLSGKILSSILLHFAEEKGKFKANKLLVDSNLDWSDFLGKNTNIEEFISDNKLEFMTMYPKNTDSSLSIEDIKQHLLRLLKSEDIKDICDWLEDVIVEKLNPSFIRSLVCVVLENAIKDSNPDYKLDEKELMKTVSILSTFINHNQNLELQALYSIQSLVHHWNHPKDLLLKVFHKLFDEDVISKESFENWKRSEDPEERDGREEALESVKLFFSALENADLNKFHSDEVSNESIFG